MSASASSIVAIIAAQRRRLAEWFVAAGATNEGAAVSPEQVPRAGYELIGQLKDQGIIRTSPNGYLYLDEARWAQACSLRRASARNTAIAVTILAATLWAVWYFAHAA